jgi:hypothetical protein
MQAPYWLAASYEFGLILRCSVAAVRAGAYAWLGDQHAERGARRQSRLSQPDCTPAGIN